jgi:hypothetical protein
MISNCFFDGSDVGNVAQGFVTKSGATHTPLRKQLSLEHPNGLSSRV